MDGSIISNAIQYAPRYNKCRKTDEVDFYCSLQAQRNQSHGFASVQYAIAFERIHDAIVVSV